MSALDARSLVVGLDGADLSVIRTLGPSRLPVLHALMERGVVAAMDTVQPPATLPNWTTFLTTLDPGEHGVFDFTTREGYSVRFTAGSAREAPTFAARLDALGKRCACLFFPATYPPERLRHGIFISGWDAPVAFSGDASFVWPRELHAELLQRFGPQRFDDVDEFAADQEHWHARLADALIGRIEHRVELALHLLQRGPFDLFAIYFGESDTAAHHLWSLWDAGSPRHPQRTGEFLREGLPRVYAALDRAVGTLLEAAGGDAVELTLVSDHGSGGSSDKVLYLNHALQRAGLLRMKPAARGRAFSRLKDVALTTLPPALRERVFRLAGTRLPSWLESQVRFGQIDMPRTRVFSDELNYFPALHVNLRGREPHGVVDPAELPALREEIERALLALRDPWSGRPVVRAVHARQDLYRGPYLERAPDFALELELDDGYSYNLMPSASAPEPGMVFRRLSPDEYLGRKGRSLPGSHRRHGLYLAAGPRVTRRGEVQAHIADASATLLARMDVALPAGAPGGVLPLGPTLGTDGVTLPESSPAARDAKDAAAEAAHDEARVAARLRNLGYIE